MFGFFDSYFANDLAIDLGTANTLIWARGKGIVLDEPSVVAIRHGSGPNDKKVIQQVGLAAKQMLGRAPGNINVIRPMRDCVIADFTVTEQMLKQFIKRVHKSGIFSPSPRIVICVPCGSTQVERRAIRESAYGAGARRVELIEEPMAAAIGAGLPVTEPAGNMIIDIGGGTTEIAVISLGGVVLARSLRIAGDEMNEDIVRYMRDAYNLAIGERTAEDIKIAIGSAYPQKEQLSVPVRGRDLVTGLPKEVKVTDEDVREALSRSVRVIINNIKTVLEETPPELVTDIATRGIVLAGGGSMIRGLDRFITTQTGITVRRVEDPLTTVVRGTGLVLDDLDFLRHVLIDTSGYGR